MQPGAVGPDHAPRGSDELLALVGARPREALAQARAVLAGRPGPYEASIAHQMVGLVLRDYGDAAEAVRELRAALRQARAAGRPQREADVLSTLGATLIRGGQTRPGLRALDAALQLATGPAAGRVLVRRGIRYAELGRHAAALADLSRAVRLLRPVGDAVWEARALTGRALAHLAVGSAGRAQADLARAETLLAASGQDLELAYARHNRGLVAFRAGDLPGALRYLDEASAQYRALEAPTPDLAIDRCAVLLAAGLAADALNEAEAAARLLELGRSQPAKRAELLVSAARAALAAGNPALALAHAGEASRMFTAQHRAWWQAQAAMLLAEAQLAAGDASALLLRRARRIAARLDEVGPADRARARLLAGRTAMALGRAAEADRHFRTAASARRGSGTALARLTGWLAEALRAELAADPRRLLRACACGLDLLDDYRLAFGATELRVQASAYGTELAALAQRCALASGRPRLLLQWADRWRATALAAAPGRPAASGELQAGLTALRELTSRAEQARAAGEPAAALQREQVRLEAAVRAAAMQAPAAGSGGGRGLDVAALLAALGAGRLVQIADVDGTLQLLICGAGRVRRVTAGRAQQAATEVEHARFALRRLAYGRAAGRPEHDLAVLTAAGARLQEVFLGAASRQLGDGPVVIVPPGRLHAVPWALLPALAGRAVSVAPSARSWLRARLAGPPPGRRTVLIRGPGAVGAEVPVLAAHDSDATVLDGAAATTAAVLAALDGAALAHLAAHGTFRADSPLFSSLALADGPLTGYDLESLPQAPYRLILPSCDSGLHAPAGADELLGLAATLLPLGTAGIAASIGPVHDGATAALMLALHRRLRVGATMAEGLRDARAEVAADPVQLATGWSFLALGAA
ncbi:MAG: CHAT domain-containing protein [Streptosporangiaceae bacterium]